jgi:hypothetical protein
MTTVTPLRPLGDPAKGWWNYADLAAVFGLSIDTVKRRMAGWEAQAFPAPMPWHRNEKRWHPPAVLGWKARREAGAGARVPVLEVIQGGRA